MFIEVWNNGEPEIINSQHIVRLYATKTMTEVHLAYVPWGVADDVDDDDLDQGMNIILYDVAYAEFKRALSSGLPFMSFCEEDEA